MVMDSEPGAWGVCASNKRFGSLLVIVTFNPSSGAGSANFSDAGTCKFRPTVGLLTGGMIAGFAALNRAGALQISFPV